MPSGRFSLPSHHFSLFWEAHLLPTCALSEVVPPICRFTRTQRGAPRGESLLVGSHIPPSGYISPLLLTCRDLKRVKSLTLGHYISRNHTPLLVPHGNLILTITKRRNWGGRECLCHPELDLSNSHRTASLLRPKNDDPMPESQWPARRVRDVRRSVRAALRRVDYVTHLAPSASSTCLWT